MNGTLKRRAEIALAASAIKANRGDEIAARRVNGISGALTIHEGGGDLAAALTNAGIDPATI